METIQTETTKNGATQNGKTRTVEATPRYDGFSLTLERRFDHAPERVFDAWTKPDQIRRWMGPEGLTCEGAEAVAEPGGAYRFPMKDPDGGDHVVYGTYRVVDRPTKLVFTWAWEVCGDDPGGYEMQITMDFRVDGDGTVLTIFQEGLASEEARDRHNEGWTSSFVCLAAFLSKDA